MVHPSTYFKKCSVVSLLLIHLCIGNIQVKRQTCFTQPISRVHAIADYKLMQLLDFSKKYNWHIHLTMKYLFRSSVAEAKTV